LFASDFTVFRKEAFGAGNDLVGALDIEHGGFRLATLAIGDGPVDYLRLEGLLVGEKLLACELAQRLLRRAGLGEREGRAGEQRDGGGGTDEANTLTGLSGTRRGPPSADR
jgi:hypothetical protein